VSNVRQPLGAHPRAARPRTPHQRAASDRDSVLTAAIDALSDCAQACAADAGDDLSENDVTEMIECIRLCLDCADICNAAVAVTSRADCDVDVTMPLLEACVASCKNTGDECEQHGRMHEHCRICALACRRCEQACRTLLDSMQ
jgi:hypothetical protein